MFLHRLPKTLRFLRLRLGLSLVARIGKALKSQRVRSRRGLICSLLEEVCPVHRLSLWIFWWITISGQFRTLTCAGRNGPLGRSEAELTRWGFGELANVRTHANVGVRRRRRRRIPRVRVRVRWTDDGQFVLIGDCTDPALRDMLQSDNFSRVGWPLPDASPGAA